MANQGEIQHLQRRFLKAILGFAKNIGGKVASKFSGAGKNKPNTASNKSKEEAEAKKKEAAAKEKEKKEKEAAAKEKEKKEKEVAAKEKEKKEKEAAANEKEKKEKESADKKKKAGIAAAGVGVGVGGIAMMDDGGSKEETGKVVEGEVDPATSNISDESVQSNVTPGGSVIPADQMTNTSPVQAQQTSPGAAAAGAPRLNAQPNGWAGSFNPVVTGATPVVQPGDTNNVVTADQIPLTSNQINSNTGKTQILFR
ncbi:hypothetical protein IWQ61_004529 [Dispira simplex]|nr:hypothetical protein IWQ61_004529 [Dispira simplex]